MNNKHIYKTRTRYSEIDGMKLVHNSNYLIYFEEARTDLVRANNYSYEQIEKDGFMFPISEIKLNFKNPIYYDELISVFTYLEYVKNFSLKFLYEIYKENNELACNGYTIHACMDKTSYKILEINDKLKSALKKYIIK